MASKRAQMRMNSWSFRYSCVSRSLTDVQPEPEQPAQHQQEHHGKQAQFPDVCSQSAHAARGGHADAAQDAHQLRSVRAQTGEGPPLGARAADQRYSPDIYFHYEPSVLAWRESKTNHPDVCILIKNTSYLKHFSFIFTLHNEI